jgi:hypothetical protein
LDVVIPFAPDIQSFLGQGGELPTSAAIPARRCGSAIAEFLRSAFVNIC